MNPKPQPYYAHVVCDDPPGEMRLVEFLAWRAREDVRMELELTRQRHEYFAAMRNAGNESLH